MFLRKFAPWIVGALVAATSISVGIAPASASMQASAIAEAKNAVGFIITYQDGVRADRSRRPTHW